MAVGWGTFFGAIGKIIDKLPLQGKLERWKNELDTLKKERTGILRRKSTPESQKRLIVVVERIEYLNQCIRNAAND